MCSHRPELVFDYDGLTDAFRDYLGGRARDQIIRPTWRERHYPFHGPVRSRFSVCPGRRDCQQRNNRYEH